GQLTGTIHADGSTSTYTYDAIGNITKRVSGGGTATYSYYQNGYAQNTPRLRNSLGADLNYDANGNLLSGGYTWDAANRLSAVSQAQFAYDFRDRINLYTPAPGA